MKTIYFYIAIVCMVLQACSGSGAGEKSSLQGTWKLLSGTTIQGKDTVHTDYTQGQEMIKIINDTHFAFLRHDLGHGKDSSAVFVAGGGSYTVKGNQYTEHLEYFNVREWEGNDFTLQYEIRDDTLITRGIEAVEALGVNHINIEKYVRVP
ncbi:hypothetical protein [Sinomicrobium oceani]|uniref:hypothetical protein n=1 Tax=Sinomicrobium oceani TaxID=1150368 RepID=UPI00227AA218|nr:hypothetical protein [Sinomicrobium oceani]